MRRDPITVDLIPATGGVRKLRWALPGGGAVGKRIIEELEQAVAWRMGLSLHNWAQGPACPDAPS